MIYLDHAATSYPKPPVVVDAVRTWYDDIGCSPDRGDGPSTRDAAATVQRCREGVARRTGHRPEHVAFCSGATEALNLAIRALASDGALVATTTYEHSSVARALRGLRAERGVRVAKAASIDELIEDIDQRRPDLVVMTHASNVTGEELDAAAVAASTRSKEIPLLLDASQTAGYLPLDVGAAAVVASAHKALHGPPGLGFISVDDRHQLAPQKFGGTGSSAALEDHPTSWPQAFEAGTPNMPALYGLDAALSWCDEAGADALLARARGALRRLTDALSQLEEFTLYGAPPETGVPVLSLCHARYDPLELAAILSSAGVHARAGFHCAPWIHEHLGTHAAGTLRLSPGPATTNDEIDAVVQILASL